MFFTKFCAANIGRSVHSALRLIPLFHRHRLRTALATSVLFVCPAQLAIAQATGAPAPAMDHAKMGPTSANSDPLGVPMNRAASGTTWIPDAVQLPTHNVMAGSWHLMMHGFVFGQYNKQGGERGDDQFGSLNWGMFMASRNVKGGRLQVRTMFSLDAATVGSRGYPLLAQSGELYDNQPVVDRQHPHDFFMEMGVSYERPITKTLGITVYAAPSGEPALGPVAFMHRPSAMDLPTAPLGHHWQDATHVAFGVVSAGLFTNKFKVEGSVFNGREPDQHRWDFDKINIDSYSARVTINPNRNWSFTTGYGHLTSPEALHPEQSIDRLVGSAMYGREIGAAGQWATTFVFGQNKHGLRSSHTFTFPALSSDQDNIRTHSFLLESELMANDKNTLFARAEHVQKSGEDLVLTGPTLRLLADQKVAVRALSLGYVRELVSRRGATLGLGGMGTFNLLPLGLEAWYGSRTPLGGLVFLRLRPQYKRGGDTMTGMDHSKMS
ncbi:MAG: hypothetical protein ABJB74_00115 [Gemmatimonas sp.]